jgi:hypothetical protein
MLGQTAKKLFEGKVQGVVVQAKIFMSLSGVICPAKLFL